MTFKNQNLLIFNSVKLTNQSQVAKLNSVYIFILKGWSDESAVFINTMFYSCDFVMQELRRGLKIVTQVSLFITLDYRAIRIHSSDA